MHSSSSRLTMMKNKNMSSAKQKEPPVRITRARAKVLDSLGGVPSSSKPSFKQEKKVGVRTISKRSASEENKASLAAVSLLQQRRRVVLKDVSNEDIKSSSINLINISRLQTSKNARKVSLRTNANTMSNISLKTASSQEDARLKLVEELSEIKDVESKDISLPKMLEETIEVQRCTSTSVRECFHGDKLPPQAFKRTDDLQSLRKKEIDTVWETSCAVSIVDIDLELKDSPVWSLYAPDIYNNIKVTEIERRPSPDYMKFQKDINPHMRRILIDWLVEVSEEYKLVPDTVYLTVNLIDRFLSQKLIDKQRLQLVGVTCMLIASKYEEICAPRVDEFCTITDDTYTREQVLRMENEALNLLHFQLSVPTTKTFLRRFVQAAQSLAKVPCIELEFLANYLAELTLLEYSFLNYLPSLIAASVVFLARWTLNQTDNPWNLTLEHYTKYKAFELKTAVLALEDLQLKSRGCPLNAVCEKYKLEKYKCVANLTSEKSVISLF